MENYNVQLTKDELENIIEVLKFHADLYSQHSSKTEWCKERYDLARRLKELMLSKKDLEQLDRHFTPFYAKVVNNKSAHNIPLGTIVEVTGQYNLPVRYNIEYEDKRMVHYCSVWPKDLKIIEDNESI